jgi:hypothetical protein
MVPGNPPVSTLPYLTHLLPGLQTRNGSYNCTVLTLTNITECHLPTFADGRGLLTFDAFCSSLLANLHVETLADARSVHCRWLAVYLRILDTCWKVLLLLVFFLAGARSVHCRWLAVCSPHLGHVLESVAIVSVLFGRC